MENIPDWFCPGCERKIAGSKKKCFRCDSNNPGLSGNNHNGRVVTVVKCVNVGTGWDWSWEEGESRENNDVYRSIV